MHEKLFSCGVALIFCFMLSPQEVSDAYTVLGQAHFILCYLYQVKAGKASPVNLFLYAACAVAIFSAAFSAASAFTLFAAAFLVYHVYIGEMKLLSRTMKYGYFGLITAIAMINGSWLANALWHLDIRVDLLCYFILAAGFLSGLWYILHHKTIEIEAFFVFLVIVLLGYIGLELTGYAPSPYKTLGFIIITHYMTWYVATVRRFSGDPQGKLPIFLKEMLFVNLCILTGYVAITRFLGMDNFLYKVWYMPLSFYVWAVMHFLSTFKIKDYVPASQ